MRPNAQTATWHTPRMPLLLQELLSRWMRNCIKVAAFSALAGSIWDPSADNRIEVIFNSRNRFP